MTILVTGAAGNIGRNLVDRLLAQGHEVRALTRDTRRAGFPPGAEVHAGDLRRPETLTGALRDVASLFLFPVPETVEDVVDRAKRAGVRRIVVLSSAAVTAGIDTDFHAAVERAVQDSGLEYTHLRPGEFAANKLILWAGSIREEHVVREPAPNALAFPIHERDIADAAFEALTRNDHLGRTHTMHGPDLLTRRRQAELIGTVLGVDIRFEAVTPQEAREFYLAQGGIAAEYADLFAGFKDYNGNDADPGDIEKFDPSAFGPLPTVESVTGTRPRTFAQWAAEHASDFRPV